MPDRLYKPTRRELLAIAALGAVELSTLPSCTPQRPTIPEHIVDLGNDVSIEMLLIPAGNFMMGSPSGESWRKDNEGPQHEVYLGSFYLGKYELTQAQWVTVMGTNPSRFQDPDLPVENINWQECQGFIENLNAAIGGLRFRLPTEAEWEYACRAGTKTPFYFGKDEGIMPEYAWYDENSGTKTHPVGQLKPNNWGLYDMCGNVDEWCQDWFKPYQGYRGNKAKSLEGISRIKRGGSFITTSLNNTQMRSAHRSYHRYDNPEMSLGVGMRLARDAKQYD